MSTHKLSELLWTKTFQTDFVDLDKKNKQLESTLKWSALTQRFSIVMVLFNFRSQLVVMNLVTNIFL